MTSGFEWLKQQAIPTFDQPDTAEEAMAENERMMREAEEAQRNLAQMVHDVLTTGRGPELLDYLRERTIEMPSAVDPQVSIEAPAIGINPAEWLFIREGQNSVTRHLQGLIRLARFYANQPATPEGN